jgi:hypothetical protein
MDELMVPDHPFQVLDLVLFEQILSGPQLHVRVVELLDGLKVKHERLVIGSSESGRTAEP